MVPIILQNSVALLTLPFLWLIFLLATWRRRFKPFGAFLIRLTILVLIVLALSQPIIVPTGVALNETKSTPLILLVDQSASLGEIGQKALRQKATQWATKDSRIFYFADRPISDFGFGIGDFGLKEERLQNLKSPIQNGDVQNQINPEITDLAKALSMGAALGNHLVLLSDGVATQGDTLAVAAELAQQHVLVDVLIPDEATLRDWHGGQKEVWLTRLTVPPILRQGEPFVIEVGIQSDSARKITLKLNQDKTVLAEDGVTLQAGDNLFTFKAKADAVGLQSYQAIIAADEDGQPENNRLAAVSQVYLPSKVLVVGDDLPALNRFTDLLRQAGFEPTAISATQLPNRLSELDPYDGMVLLDVSARALLLPQMVAVQEFVRSLGRGLLVTGGRNSLSAGSYEDTPLAELLPLSLEPPPRKERPPVAFLLIIDHSGSMVEGENVITKLAMAKEAAIRATNILGPDDLIGVLMFDNRYEWVVPFQRVSDGAVLLQIQQNIATIPPSGGTRILKALQVGLPELAAQAVVGNGARHAVLLTDGKSFDGLDGDNGYEQVLNEALNAHITLSTIAIGNGADRELLAYLAKNGRGRYHFAEVPEELPALTIAESDILRSNSVQEGTFQVSATTPHPMVRGFFNTPQKEDVAGVIPTLSGYLALTPKSGIGGQEENPKSKIQNPKSLTPEIVLQVGPGDPLLAVWGYGLGRVAVWSADTGQAWAGEWFTWADAPRFWGQTMGYLLPSPDVGLLQLKAEVKADGVVTLIANSLTEIGQPVDLAQTQAQLHTPSGRDISLNLPQVSPGRYQQVVRLPNPGAYQLNVTQAEKRAMLGFVVPYPAEYAWHAEGSGESLLRTIATMTGGKILTMTMSPLEETTSENSSAPLELWPWLLGIALLLWPIEIAWRRWGGLRMR